MGFYPYASKGTAGGGSEPAFSSVVFTIGAESGDEVNVEVSFLDAAGNIVLNDVAGHFWFSGGSDGRGVGGTEPDGGVLPDVGNPFHLKGNHYLFNSSVSELVFQAEHSGNLTLYMAVLLPSGGIAVSPALTWTA